MDLSEKKDGMIREIIREGALKGEWLPMHEAFHSGDAMGFDVAGVAVRATVTFDRYGFVVNMTSPVECTGRKDIYYRQQTFFRRNRPGVSLFKGGVKGGPATQQCVDGAREVLIGLYTDWMILRSRREEIRRKLAGFTEWAASFNRQEKKRVAPDRQKLQKLAALMKGTNTDYHDLYVPGSFSWEENIGSSDNPVKIYSDSEYEKIGNSFYRKIFE